MTVLKRAVRKRMRMGMMKKTTGSLTTPLLALALEPHPKRVAMAGAVIVEAVTAGQ